MGGGSGDRIWGLGRSIGERTWSGNVIILETGKVPPPRPLIRKPQMKATERGL